MKGERQSTFKSSHIIKIKKHPCQRSNNTTNRERELFRLKRRRTDRSSLFIRKRHIKFLYERQRYATRGLYTTYIYTKFSLSLALSLSLCVCLEITHPYSWSILYSLFLLSSFSDDEMCFGLVASYIYEAMMMVFILFSFQKGFNRSPSSNRSGFKTQRYTFLELNDIENDRFVRSQRFLIGFGN